LLTDLERALPSDEVLEHDPLEVYEAVHRFVSEFPTARDNQERIIALYGEAETQLRQAWGELLNVVIQGVGRTSFAAVKDLMDKGRLAPIQGVQEITGSLPPDVRRLAQRVKRDLYSSRPARERNNQVDTIDFTVTLLLNQQEQDRRERYISIYTQSWALIRACTARKQLRWDDDFLVRGAQYFKFRTRLQELFPSSVEGRLQFVEEWREECRKLQRAVTNLVDLETELPALTQPTLELLELFRRFDEECRIPLSFVGKTAEQEEPVSRQKAERLYNTLRDSGEFRGKTEDAYRVLKAYLQDLHECLGLFVPEAAKTEDAKEYMEALLEWLDLEEIERDKD
jgi:hypothetical protein